MIRPLAVVTLCLPALLLGSHPAPAQPAPVPGEVPPAVRFPETPLGEAAQALLAAVNDLAEDAPARFARRYLSERLFRGIGRERTAARYREMVRRLREQSGGLDPVAVRGEPGNPPSLAVICRTRRGDRRVGIECVAGADDPSRLALIDLHPLSPPPPYSWPTGELDEGQLAVAIRQRVEMDAAAGRFSGVVLVARGDRILFHDAFGDADREGGRRNTRETRFDTASVGKMVTGVAVAQLEQAGRLRFEDRLADVLPEYPNAEAARQVTVHHLLTHTSGIGDPFFSAGREPGRAYPTPWDNLRLFAAEPLRFPPGEKHDYSNGNYAVLAAVVEKVAGQPFAAYVRERVYRPAGMPAADPAAHARLPLALGYTHSPVTDPLGIEPRTRSQEGPPPAEGMPGFGGSRFTAMDVFRFMRALREHRFLSPTLTETVTTGKVDAMPGAPLRYGYGFYDNRMFGPSVRGHSGGGGNMGYGAHVELLWDRGDCVIVLGNVDLDDVRPLALGIVSFLARQNAAGAVKGTGG